MIEAKELNLPKVEVISDKTGVKIADSLGRKIVGQDIITGVLNAALIEEFPNLDALHTDEGGVSGIYKGAVIELRNLKETIGLENINSYQNREDTWEITTFYKRMLLNLLATGDIFAVKESDEETEVRIWNIVKMAIINFQGEDFFQRVFQRITAVSEGKREDLKRREYRKFKT